MLVECGHCDWTFERDETDDLDEHSQNVMDAQEEYAKHVWLTHPEQARIDYVCIQYIRAIAAHQARTS